MKLEKRVAMLTRVGSRITMVVIRGVKGIEYVSILDSCSEVKSFLASRRGIAGEISAYVSLDGVCESELSSVSELDKIDPSSAPRRLRETIERLMKIVNRIGALTLRGMIEVLRADS